VGVAVVSTKVYVIWRLKHQFVEMDRKARLLIGAGIAGVVSGEPSVIYV